MPKSKKQNRVKQLNYKTEKYKNSKKCKNDINTKSTKIKNSQAPAISTKNQLIKVK